MRAPRLLVLGLILAPGFIKETSGTSHFGSNPSDVPGYFDTDDAGDLVFYRSATALAQARG